MNTNKTKILVSAYACEPNKGSEPGVGWHWALEMSKYFEVWVVTRRNNQSVIEKHMSNIKNEHLHFLYYDPPKYLTFWKRQLKGVHFFYAIWQKGVNRLIKETMEKENIEIFHQLTFGTALLPTSLYGQKKDFIWGPIGGCNTIPKEFSKHYTLRGKIVENMRRLMVFSLKLNYQFKKRCKNAKLILCKDEATLKCIPKKQRHKCIIFTDVAVDIEKKANNNPKEKQITKFISIGQLEAWRGFDLLIEAFYQATQINKNIQLEIIGDGYYKSHLEKLIEKKQMKNHISLSGRLKIEKYNKKMEECDVVVSPCLKEGAVTAAFDSIAYGKPLICIDTGGFTKYFDNDYAYVIERKGRKNIIDNLTKYIIEVTNPLERKRISSKLKELHEKFSWHSKGLAIKEILEKHILQEKQ